MKNFFNRNEEEIEDFLEEEDELDIINLDETSGWSKLEVAEEMAKQQATNLMDEIGDELAIIDVVEEDIKIEQLKPHKSEVVSTYAAAATELREKKIQELSEEDLEEETLEEELEIEQLQDDDIEIEQLQDDDVEYFMADDEEEEDEYEEESSFGFFDNLAVWFAKWTVLDKVVAVTGVLVLVMAVLTVGIYAGKRGANKQIEAFAPIGEQLETIGVVGQDKLLAVADAKKAMLEAAKLEAELNQEYEENELSSEIKVVMKMTSVQRDLKIKFVNKKTGKLIGNVPFEVKITDADSKTYNKIDEDMDGIIYLTQITSGDYSVSMVELADMEGYSFSTSTEKIKVKDNIEYEKIDVSDEIKDQSEVDVSKEDTAQKIETEAVLTDTVEWVESTKKEVETEEQYTEVKKDTIADPALSASLGLDFSVLRAMRQGIVADGIIMPATEEVEDDEAQTSENPAETTIVLDNSSLSLKVGESKTLQASVTPADATVEWSTDDASVATVSDGTINAVAAGNTTITATAGDVSVSCQVTVTEASVAVTGISLSSSELSLKVGETATLTAKVAPENATEQTVTWSSDNTSVATVSGGVVTAVAKGTTNIKVTSSNNITVSCQVTVTESTVAVTGITLDKNSLSLKVGAEATLAAVIAPNNATDKTVVWSSDNTSVATVSNGTVKAAAKGTATITAKAGDKTASCTVTVTESTVAVTGITLNKNTLTLVVEGSETLTATVTPDNATNKTVTWNSSDEKIATVDAGGKVSAVAAGSVNITATAGDKTATCTVTVKAKETETSIILDKTTADMKVGDSLTLAATVTPAGKTVTWKSSDETKATVSEGKVTATAEGEVIITATVDNVSVTCKITITSGYDPKSDTTKSLKDKSGNQIYVLVDGKYVEAKVADYYKYDTFYKKEKVSQYTYTGWQNLDGKTYYFDKNGKEVTGAQVIQGAQYNFNSDGTLNTGSGILGIDVSTWNGNIDWNKVKNSGVSYVIIRTGFRGSTQGSLVEDNKFRQNIQGATNAGIKVGVYFFSQAINEVEAVEEASMVLSQIKGYKITYPVFIDVEPSGGRADSLSSGDRTKVINAFCQTIQNGGYRAGIYANKTWLSQKMNVSALSGYKIWLAQYNSTVTYGGRYDMWQYSDKGTISGISGKVDMNLSYLTY